MRLLVLSILALVLVPSLAKAQSVSCNFSVAGVNFGNVDTLSGAAVDVTGTVNITCTGILTDLRFCLGINAGSGGATSGIRHMRNAANAALDFTFYQNPGRTTPWGSKDQPSLGSVRTVDVLQLLGGSVSVPIYARVMGNQQSAPVGLYTSALQLNFTYGSFLLIKPPCSNLNEHPGSASFSVQANVAADCRVTAQDINFGNQGVLDSNVDAAGGVDVTCTSGTSYNVGLNNGLNGGSPTTRRMTLAGEDVLYGLYMDGARSQPWGDTIGTDTVSGTGAGTEQRHTVYGRVPPQATPPPGTYSDTVVVTVTY